MLSKAVLRKNLLLQRKVQLLFEKNLNDEQIAFHIQNFIDKQQVQTVSIYLSLSDEVETVSIVKRLLLEAKITVTVPRVTKNELQFYRVTSLDSLSKSTFGILEPDMDNTKIPVQEIKLWLIPGIGFDMQGNRLGYGLGYYDRILKDTKGIKLGLAYQFQIIDKLPVTEHDIKMDFLITQKGVFPMTY